VQYFNGVNTIRVVININRIKRMTNTKTGAVTIIKWRLSLEKKNKRRLALFNEIALL
jgi:hypothetical protein